MIGVSSDVLIAYFLGGFTLLPACFLLLLLHAYLSFPVKDARNDEASVTERSLQTNDDETNLPSSKHAESLLQNVLGDHEADVAAGYFAVCREYVPGGVNGKPPERVTPVGTIVAPESPSVYQSMYRSIFDRKQSSAIESQKLDGKHLKRSRNVFYVVLRHGHLMLYEDSEQLEVKHVISLENHSVSVYGGGEPIPEGELWIKRNCIRLQRDPAKLDEAAKPFFLFSENCSDKEDFYYALLRNQDVKHDACDGPPEVLRYDPRHIIGLVKQMHSSEDQLHTRWINGLIGRLFLALYKTAEVQAFVREKITKKIARVQKPGFLSGIVLQKIDIGDSAPQITNPKLRELTINGDCWAEADIQYNGNFRLEIAATARLDLGTRFKAREVNIVLAVVVKKLGGHGLLKFKPPPSNRVWISFERMPDMDLHIEPVVSSRQITYSVILRAIRSRIREVIAETIVLPHWDDIPFTDTEGQAIRGGIWADAMSSAPRLLTPVKIPDEAPAISTDETTDMPSLYAAAEDLRDTSEEAQTNPTDPSSNAFNELERDTVEDDGTAGMTATSIKADRPPNSLRSSSFASAANPLLSDAQIAPNQNEKSQSPNATQDATALMIAISKRSKPMVSSEGGVASTKDKSGTEVVDSPGSSSHTASLEDSGRSQSTSKFNPPDNSSAHATGGAATRTTPTPDAGPTRSQTAAQLKSNNKSMAALGAATAVARKWGWGVLSRNTDTGNGHSSVNSIRAGTPANPIGRGQPIPSSDQSVPPAQGQRSATMPVSMPKRKPTNLQQQSDVDKARPSPPIPRSSGRRKSSMMEGVPQHGDGLLVVQAPADDASIPAPHAQESREGPRRGEGSEQSSLEQLVSPPSTEQPEPCHVDVQGHQNALENDTY